MFIRTKRDSVFTSPWFSSALEVRLKVSEEYLETEHTGDANCLLT